MEQGSTWLVELQATFTRMAGQFVEYLPNLIGGIVLLAVGYIVARVLRMIVVRSSTGLNAALDGSLRRGVLQRLRLSPAIIELLGKAVFWFVLVVFLVPVVRMLGLTTFGEWLDRLAGYLPEFLTGALIIAVGAFLGVFVRDITRTTVSATRIGRPELLGRVAQVAVVLVAAIIGFAQIGIDVSLLIVVIAIPLAAVLGGFGLAFGLGARSTVQNLLGAHFVRDRYAVGDQVRVAGTAGRIAEITPVAVVLESEQGRITIPARLFAEQVSVLAVGEAEDG